MFDNEDGFGNSREYMDNAELTFDEESDSVLSYEKDISEAGMPLPDWDPEVFVTEDNPEIHKDVEEPQTYADTAAVEQQTEVQQEAESAVKDDISEVFVNEEFQKFADDMKNERNELHNEISEIKSLVNNLNNVFSRMAVNCDATAQQVNEVNNNLHKENQKLKDGLYESFVIPLLKEMIEMSEETEKLIAFYEKKEKPEIAEVVEEIQERIHIALERYNVEVYKPEEGDSYKPIEQKAVQIVKTDDPAKDKIIKECRGYGYRYVNGDKSKVLAPCKVCAYKYEK